MRICLRRGPNYCKRRQNYTQVSRDKKTIKPNDMSATGCSKIIGTIAIYRFVVIHLVY